MSSRIWFNTILLTCALTFTLSGCAKISLGGSTGKGGTGSGQTGQTPGGTGQPDASQPTAPAANSAPMEGYWTIAFQFGDNVGKSSIQMHQQGSQLSGSGTDEDNNRSFNVTGTLNGDTVQFTKQYDAGSGGQTVPAVQYDGKLQMVNDKDYQGPYMSGQYSTTINGKQVSNSWEAQLSSSQGGGQQPAQEQKPPPPAHPDKAPDLSGKWKVAYKANFKTIKSTMFIEQDGDHLTGRGVDVNTNEKFDITKGWYAFPKITIVRTYKKGKGGAASDRTMQFKGTVQWVSDKDYQGPYLHGETEGGGDWEAQLVR